jgi:hypothetical protein
MLLNARHKPGNNARVSVFWHNSMLAHNGSIQSINFRGPAGDKRGCKEERLKDQPLHKPQLPQDQPLCSFENFQYIRCDLAHEKAAWKARRSCENFCVCGLNALPRWDFKTKVPALLSPISHLHHPPPPLISSQSSQWYQNNMKMAF